METRRTTRRTYHLLRGEIKTNSTTTTTHNTSTSTTSGKNNGEILMDLEVIKHRYYECLGMQMPGHIVQQVHGWLEAGYMPTEYFLYGLQEAAMAPRPSWRYAMAVVRRLCTDKYPAGLLPVSWL